MERWAFVRAWNQYGRPRSRRKLLFLLAAAGAALFVLFTGMAAASLISGVRARVVDGGQSYSVRTERRDVDAILKKAEGLGLAPLGALDEALADWNTDTITLRRGVDLYLRQAGETTQLTAYKGDTVGEALAANGVSVEAGDRISPSPETVIGAALTVEVSRLCTVRVTANGKTQTLEMLGGSVADALKEAGVKLAKDECCNYSLDQPLTDGMELEVLRAVRIRVTTKSGTKEYAVSAATVEDALEQCGVGLGEQDRLNVRRTARPVEGMEITVTRVRVKEETETEELDYKTKTTYSKDLKRGEKNTLTAGLKGEKTYTYRAVYVEEKLESRKLVSEEVTREPIDRIIVQGTGSASTGGGGTGSAGSVGKLPQLEFDADAEVIGSSGDSSLTSHRFGNNSSSGSAGSGSGAGGSGAGSSGGRPNFDFSFGEGVGTFTDAWGQEVPYAKKMEGECTAYCIPGGTTSVGLTAERGIIAVDPDVIPYGTRMYVASPDGSVVYGYGVAGDTGGACLAGDIVADLCYDTLEECSIIGRRDMVIYLLP